MIFIPRTPGSASLWGKNAAQPKEALCSVFYFMCLFVLLAPFFNGPVSAGFCPRGQGLIL